MTGDDDDRPGYLEREKKSFAELDRARRARGSSGERRPRDPGAARREARATRQYLDEVEGMFGGNRERSEALGRAMLDARGTPELPAACRAYLASAGPPEELRYVSCFLDSGDGELVLAGLDALQVALDAGSLETTAGLRTQLRMLTEDPDDEVAGAAEDLLDAI